MANDFSDFPLILLAGGKSSRLGIPKGLFPVRGHSWIEQQCEQFRNLGGRKIILVLGYDIAPYAKVVSLLAEVSTVMNPDPSRGQFSSIQSGITLAMNWSCEGAFVLPIDVPVPRREVWTKLLGSLEPGVRVVQPTILDPSESGGRPRGGHPVLIARAEVLELVAMPASSRLDERLGILSRDEPGAVLRVQVDDPTIRVNLNSKEEWENYMAGEFEQPH